MCKLKTFIFNTSLWVMQCDALSQSKQALPATTWRGRGGKKVVKLRKIKNQ